MNNLRARNPQLANQVQNLINNRSDPMQFYHQLMKDKTPEQMENFYKFIKQYGVSEETLNQLQNGVNTE